MAEWTRLTKTVIAPMHRTGWLGLWDAVVAFVKREPRRTVPTKITASVYVKSDKEVKLEIFGFQVEEGPTLESRMQEITGINDVVRGPRKPDLPYPFGNKPFI